MRKELLIKTLTLGIVVLFICVSFQPIIAEKTVSVEKETDNNNFDFDEAKEYLFQTIIEITNNPDVKELIKQSNHKLFTSDYDYKSIFSQLLFKKPRLLKSILFTRPKLTYEYLETSYNNGVELVNILGEEKSLEMVDSVSISNPELFIELKKIILYDKELSNRIIVLEEMNNNFQYNLDFRENQGIFCIILFFCFLWLCSRPVLVFGEIFSWAEGHHRLLLALISYPIYYLFYSLAVSILNLMEFLECYIDVTPDLS